LQLQKSEYLAGGYFSELTFWLNENIQTFGFYRPYQKDQGGVAEEPWHLSYFPIADSCLELLDVDLIRETILSNAIFGKSLIEQELLNIYQQYICNITPR